MNKRIVFGVLAAMAVLLVPGTSHARYLNTSTGRFQTMDSFRGDNEDPLSLHKYLYAEDDAVNGTDPTGLEIWLCTRTTEDVAPVYGVGRHAYLWDDRTNAPSPRSCGQEGLHWLNRNITSEPRDIGPIAGMTNDLPADCECYIIEGSKGHEDEIMTYARQHINDQWLWWPGWDNEGAGGNDCHSAAVTVLSHFPYLKIPPHLRYTLQDKFLINAMTVGPIKSILYEPFSPTTDIGFYTF